MQTVQTNRDGDTFVPTGRHHLTPEEVRTAFPTPRAVAHRRVRINWTAWAWLAWIAVGSAIIGYTLAHIT